MLIMKLAAHKIRTTAKEKKKRGTIADKRYYKITSLIIIIMVRRVQHHSQFQPKTRKPTAQVIVLSRKNRINYVVNIWFHTRLLTTIAARVANSNNRRS